MEPLKPGDKFGDRYQLLSKLGEGGMGEVIDKNLLVGIIDKNLLSQRPAEKVGMAFEC